MTNIENTALSGKEDGALWAKDIASKQELQRLEKHIGVADQNYPMFDEEAPSEDFIRKVRNIPEGRIERCELEEVFGDDFEDYLNDEKYVTAFAEGALEAWEHPEESD